MTTSKMASRITISIPGGEMSPNQVEMGLEASATLANLSSIFNDLLIASMAAKQINEPALEKPEFLYVRRACWEAAITAYSRCFEQGQGVDRQTRTRLNEFVNNLPTDLRECHDRIRHYRGKRIGHHVAQESGQEVRFYLGTRPDGNDLEVTDVLVVVETELYEIELLEQLGQLTELLRGIVGKRIDELRQEILNKARAKISTVKEAMDRKKPWTA